MRDDSQDDAVLREFLDFIDRDIESHPEHVTPATKEMKEAAELLVDGINVDLNEPLDLDDE